MFELRLDRALDRLLLARCHGRRKAALAKLERLERKSVEARLFEALAEERSRVRVNAAWALCRLDPDRPVEPMVTALRRRAAETTDTRYEPPDAQELVELGLHGCDCKGLRRSELLSDVLTDAEPDALLRFTAAFTLGNLPGNPSTIDALLNALNDPNPGIRKTARKSLERARRTVGASEV